MAPGTLATTIDDMVAHARTMGASQIYGASEAGQAVAGAMAYRYAGLRLWQPGDPGRVLLIDAVVAGLAGLEVAAGKARMLGAYCDQALVLGVATEDQTGEAGVGTAVLLTAPAAGRSASDPAAA